MFDPKSVELACDLDADTGDVTAVLDWELSHIGDFHEDLAWSFQPVFAQRDDDGEVRFSGLFGREEFLREYELHFDRKINPKTLYFYDILNGWKGAIIDLSTAVIAARDGNNHQDILLSWLAGSGHIYLTRLANLIHNADKLEFNQ